FRTNASTPLDSDFVIGKVDHNIDNNKLTVRYLGSSLDMGPPRSKEIPDAGAIPVNYTIGHARYTYASWTLIRSPARVNDLRFTYLNSTSTILSPGVGGNSPGKLGLPGVDQNAFPLFSASGFTPIGSSAQERRQYPIEQHQIVDNFSWIRNRHTWKAGFEARRSRNYEINLATASGAFTFDPQSSGLPGNAGTGSGLASLLLGRPMTFSEMVTEALDRHSW